jgi:hypothetical protein
MLGDEAGEGHVVPGRSRSDDGFAPDGLETHVVRHGK